MKCTMKIFKVVRIMAVIAIAAAIGFSMVSCKGGGPSAAVTKFYTAVEKGDTKAMEQVATPETVALIGMFGEKAKESLSAKGKIKKTSEKIDGDTAVVTVTYDNDETEDFDVIKVDGKWKVSINK